MRFIKKVIINILYFPILSIVYLRYQVSRLQCKSLGLVLEEFFHEDLRGFGGYAMTAKNISDYYNARPDPALKINILLASKLPSRHL